MALSMDEQRALAEIERRLVADDPGLATCMTAFRRPGPARVLRSPRARIIGSLFTVLLVAMVSLMVYAMIPFRAHGPRPPATPSAGPANVALSPAGSARPQSHPPASSSASAGTAASATSTTTAPSAAAKPSQAKDQAAGQASSPTAGP
jgi:Protein of unknown function (DUF3040)